jgi:hypothetical protein
MNTIPIMIYTAMTHLGSRRGCHDLIRCCVNAVSEGMRLKAPSAAAEVAGAAGGAALSTVDDTALMDGAEGKVCASSAIVWSDVNGVRSGGGGTMERIGAPPYKCLRKRLHLLRTMLRHRRY